MKLKKSLLATLSFLLASLPISSSQADFIDGPANVRATPGGKKIFVLNEMTYVYVLSSTKDNKWHLISLYENPTRPSADNEQYKKGDDITTMYGEQGKVLSNIPELVGYTHINNLKKIKLLGQKDINLKEGCYVAESYVDQKNKKFKTGRKKKYFPFPTDFYVRYKPGLYWFSYSGGDEDHPQAGFSFNFKYRLDRSTYNGVVCQDEKSWNVPHKVYFGCITELMIHNEKAYTMKYGDIKEKFINVEGFTPSDPSDVNQAAPCG